MKFRVNATYKEFFISRDIVAINEYNAVLIFMNELHSLISDGRSTIEENIVIHSSERLEDE